MYNITALQMFIWIVAIVGGVGIGFAIFGGAFSSVPAISELIDAICHWLIRRIEK